MSAQSASRFESSSLRGATKRANSSCSTDKPDTEVTEVGEEFAPRDLLLQNLPQPNLPPQDPPHRNFRGTHSSTTENPAASGETTLTAIGVPWPSHIPNPFQGSFIGYNTRAGITSSTHIENLRRYNNDVLGKCERARSVIAVCLRTFGIRAEHRQWQKLSYLRGICAGRSLESFAPNTATPSLLSVSSQSHPELIG